MLHVNVLRTYPEKSHEEIAEAVDKFLAAAPKGETACGHCCYGGLKPKTACASCGAWRKVPATTIPEQKTVAWLWEHISNETGECVDRGLSFHRVDPTNDTFLDGTTSTAACPLAYPILTAAPKGETA
jgi:hypothetical protein